MSAHFEGLTMVSDFFLAGMTEQLKGTLMGIVYGHLRVEFCCVNLGAYKLNSMLLEANPFFHSPFAPCVVSSKCMEVSFA